MEDSSLNLPFTLILGPTLCLSKKKNQNEQVITSEGHWILIVDWYCMCKGNRETIDYLLLHCHTATSVWSFVFMLLGLTWMPKYVCENDDFRAVKPLLWGEPCPHVLCGLCGTKEIGRSLMELSDLLIWSKRKFVFCWFYWHSFFVGCILWKGFVSVLLSLSTRIFHTSKKKTEISCR